MVPKADFVSVKRRRTSAAFETSAWTVIARPPLRHQLRCEHQSDARLGHLCRHESRLEHHHHRACDGVGRPEDSCKCRGTRPG